MQASPTLTDNDRLHSLALARAAQLRAQALDDAWTTLGRWGMRLVHAVTRGGRTPQMRIG